MHLIVRVTRVLRHTIERGMNESFRLVFDARKFGQTFHAQILYAVHDIFLKSALSMHGYICHAHNSSRSSASFFFASAFAAAVNLAFFVGGGFGGDGGLGGGGGDSGPKPTAGSSKDSP